MAQVVLVARTSALDEGNVLRWVAVRWTQQFASGRTMRIGEAFELQAGNHVVEAVVAVGLYFGGVVGLPAGGPNYRANIQFYHLDLHVEVYSAVLAGSSGIVRVRCADDGWVEHVVLRICHGMRQVGGARPGQVVFIGVGYLRPDSFCAFAAGGAFAVDIARGNFQRHRVIAPL